MSKMQAEAAVNARLVLRAATLLEGWSVKLARWVLEAAGAGQSQVGPPNELLERCDEALLPSRAELLTFARESGRISRINISRALDQCMGHQALWATLAERSAQFSRTPLDEFNRLMWTPLHFAAAYGSALVIDELISLRHTYAASGSSFLNGPMRTNGVGHSPLHVAVAHGAVEAASTLWDRVPLSRQQRDRQSRTPIELALNVLLTARRCRLMLTTLHVPPASANSQCNAASTRRRRAQRVVMASEEVLTTTFGHPHDECSNGGGWQQDGFLGEECEASSSGTEASREYDDVRRCDVPVVGSSLDSHSLIHNHLTTGLPVLIVGGGDRSLCRRWERSRFLKAYGSVVLSPQPYPYASASAHLYGFPSNNETPVRDFLTGGAIESLHRTGEGGSATATQDPNRDFVPGVFQMMQAGWSRVPYHGDPSTERTTYGDVHVDRRVAPLPEGAIERLLDDFSRPAALEDPQWLLRTATIQFYLGGRGSGAQPHWHGAAWNWLAHGRKRWYLWPPHEATYTQHHVAFTTGPLSTTDRATGEPNGDAEQILLGRPLVCEQRAGDVLIVPELWGHATVNLRASLGWASEIYFDRSYDSGMGPMHGEEWWRLRTRPD